MPVFRYQAVDKRGRNLTGMMPAMDESNLEQRLRHIGLWLTEAALDKVSVAGDSVPKYARPLSEVLQKHIDPETGLVTLPGGGPPRATMDPALLQDAPPSAMASLGFRFLVKGPATASPTCAVTHTPTCGLPDPPAT